MPTAPSPIPRPPKHLHANYDSCVTVIEHGARVESRNRDTEDWAGQSKWRDRAEELIQSHPVQGVMFE